MEKAYGEPAEAEARAADEEQEKELRALMRIASEAHPPSIKLAIPRILCVKENVTLKLPSIVFGSLADLEETARTLCVPIFYSVQAQAFRKGVPITGKRDVYFCVEEGIAYVFYSPTE